MIRKQVYIEAHHDRLLKERARRYRVTEAELIRQAIDQAFVPGVTRRADPTAWKQYKRRVAAYLKRRGPVTIKPWKREDLYDV